MVTQLEHTAQPTGCSTGWKVLLPSDSVALILFQEDQLLSASSRQLVWPQSFLWNSLFESLICNLACLSMTPGSIIAYFDTERVLLSLVSFGNFLKLLCVVYLPA